MVKVGYESSWALGNNMERRVQRTAEMLHTIDSNSNNDMRRDRVLFSLNALTVNHSVPNVLSRRGDIFRSRIVGPW